MPVSFGSDPEFFVSDGKVCVSAIPIVAGTISDRLKIQGNQFYWDNVLAECAIKPGFTKQEVMSNFKECLKTYADLVGDYTLEARASYEFTDDILADKRARIVGCNPDVCAYTTKGMKPDEKVIRKTPFRSGGGHIHLGSTTGFLREDGPKRVLLVYLMDLFLAVPSLYIDKDPSSPARRRIYGHAGRYRPTAYGMEEDENFATGIEYRPLGNFWLQSPDTVDLIYDLTMFVVDMVENDFYTKFWEFDEDKFFRVSESRLHTAFKPKYNIDLLRRCISTSNKEEAKPLFDLVLNSMPTDLQSRIEDFTKKEWNDRQLQFYKAWGIK